MSLARCFAVALAVIALACAGNRPPTIDDAVTLLHPFDPTAPIALRQWPAEYVGCTTDGRPTYGATLHLWRDHAVLTMDDEPLYAQWKTPRRKLRVSRWTVTSEQCGAIPVLYDEGLAVVPKRDEQYQYRLGASARVELIINGRTIQPDELESVSTWLGQAWQIIHMCAKAGKTA